MQRVIGTIGGVVAGMALAVVVGPHQLVGLVLMFCCAFMALYLVRVSQALMAFWITAVLALLYGLIGQFSVQTLLLRMEETAVGAALARVDHYARSLASSRPRLPWMRPRRMRRVRRTPQRRVDVLSIARLLRRIDQVVVGFATNLDHREQTTAEPSQA